MRFQTARGEIIIEIPPEFKRIGVFTSGGTDSTILLYCIIKELQDTGRDTDTVTALTLAKNNCSYHEARVRDAHPIFARASHEALPGKDVDGVIRETILEQMERTDIDAFYTGKCMNPPEGSGMPQWAPKNPTQNIRGRLVLPFRAVTKAEILSLYYTLGVEHLLEKTHSCTQSDIGQCGTCFACAERAWAFQQIGQTDPEK